MPRAGAQFGSPTTGDRRRETPWLSRRFRACFDLRRMAESLLETMRATITRHAQLEAGDVVLVGVSGGADSVALLTALVELRDALGIRVVVGHLDHGLRGVESAADRAFVEALAGELGLPIRCEAVTLPPGNVEAEARRARYAFLERAATALGASRIATAHTLEDQAETVFMRVVRGAGRRGLGGMRPVRGRIVRPLLGCDRVQVRAYLVERGRTWRRDRSNFDLRFVRSRIRHGFMPALARELNPRLARSLASLADVLREEDALLDALAARAVGDAPTLDGAVLGALERPLARRAVRAWWRRHGSGRRLGLAHVDAVLALATRDQGGGGVDVPGGTVARNGRELAFVDDMPVAGEPYALTLVLGAAVETPGGWRIAYEIADDMTRPGTLVCVVDGDAIPDALTVRNRRPGDRMRPLGLGGHTTLKRLFIARRMPRRVRALHPLVVARDEILWVPGCARSDRALVTAATQRRRVVRAERLT